MLIEFFPNPKKKPVYTPPATMGYIPYSPTIMNPDAKSQFFKTGSKMIRYWGMTEEEIEVKALKKECTIDEWIARDKQVRAEFNKSFFKVNDKAYPASAEEYETYGSVIICGVAKSYDDYGDDRKWSDDTAPLIHLVQCSVNNMMLNTSTAWLSNKRPTIKVKPTVVDITQPLH